jgi:hypothetical protein
MAARTMYQIVGRYMNGAEVTGYHLQSMDSGKNGRYTREQVVYLVGRDQVTNCSGQIYQDKVLLRGVGVSLEDLPVVQESSGEITRTENIGRVKKGTDAASALTQFTIVGTIVSGRNTIGYTIANAGGATRDISKAQVIELIGAKKIGNARTQTYKGETLIRGVGCDISELPVKKAENMVAK